MKIRRFFGKDMREALKSVKDELGGDAVIMSNKKVSGGVELVAAVDPSSDNGLNPIAQQPSYSSQQKQSDSHSPNLTEAMAQAQQQSRARQQAKNQGKPSSTPSLSEIIGDSGPDSLHALLEQQMKNQNAGHDAGVQTSQMQGQQHNQAGLAQASQAQTGQTQTAQSQAHVSHSQANHSNTSHGQSHHNQAMTSANQANAGSLHYSQQPNYGNMPEPRADDRIFRSPAFVEPEEDFQVNTHNQAAGIQPPPSVLEPAQLDNIKAELESIKNVLRFQVSELAEERKKRNNPVHHYLKEQLLAMGISADLTRQFIEFLPHEIDEKQGWKYLLNLLSNRLHVGGNDILKQSGVVALVGPTGTGKTTTLAKLAAKYAQKYGPEQVAVVTIDTYRIAAFEQLATYGKIIGCAVKKAHTSQELNEILYQFRNKKLVLIDTAGFSQRDSRLIDQLTDYESTLNIKVRKYLVIPAGAQYQVLKQTVKAYSSVNIQGCIFTKLDECYSLGEALSVVIENDLSLSYVTDGQRVPEDIKLADAANLTLIAAKLFKRYGEEASLDISTRSFVNETTAGAL
jgi:flagellar biosynthesis protein FlhF